MKNTTAGVGVRQRTRPLPKRIRQAGNHGGNWKRAGASPSKARPWLPKGVSQLEYDLTVILSKHVGERFEDQRNGEGAVDVLCRIIAERDAAMTLLALDRMKRGLYG